jgi:hypothetical protein
MQNQENKNASTENIDQLEALEQQNSATGTFAGTNPDRPGNKKINQENSNNPIVDEEAQNVTEGDSRMSGSEARDATNKANEGMKQGRDR